MSKARKPIFTKQMPAAPRGAPLTGAQRQELTLKKQELALVRRQERIYHCLPHLYGYKFYRWMRSFFENRHKVALLTSGNQLGKSSVMIRKAIDWSTDKAKWSELWPASPEPRLFFYFYPTLTVATTEFETKWVPEFMPREEFKDDPNYGWKANYDKAGNISSIAWNSGVTLQFKAYSMQAVNLQTATVWAMFVDEELPIHLYDELMFRLHATDGYFNSVFTATLGQEFWRCAMEEIGEEMEKLKDAYKVQVTAYDCQFYEDGTPSPWTDARIEAAKRKCKSQAEIDKRIYGKFVQDSGLKYGAFEPSKHFVAPFAIPSDYAIYAGVDIGSGGTNHPSAISFVAVAPNMRVAYVFKSWRGDSEVTTAADVLDKYKELAGEMVITLRQADPRAVDFHTIAIRSGLPFGKAESKHEIGEGVISTLFKNGMLYLFDEPEIRKIGNELSSLRYETKKSVAKDDSIDSLRYILPAIPFDWGIIMDRLTEADKTKAPPVPETPYQAEMRMRRGEFYAKREDGVGDWDDVEAEIEEWNAFSEGVG